MMNDFWALSVISVGLAVDCFTVSLCIGSLPRPLTFRSIFRVAFHFGLFQAGMALIGWLLGTSLLQLFAGVDHWIALILLSWVGARMIREGISSQKDDVSDHMRGDRTRGSDLIILSLATSIDALGVGLSLAILSADITVVSILIGITSLLLSVVGLLGGKRIGQRFGKRAEVFGGLVLICIGLRIVLSHIAV